MSKQYKERQANKKHDLHVFLSVRKETDSLQINQCDEQKLGIRMHTLRQASERWPPQSDACMTCKAAA